MVSSFGRIKSIPFTGPGQRNHERLRHFSKSRYGYFHLNLKLRGVSQTLYVHRLVALAFVPNPNGEKTVNHIDGVKTNNRPENLEWASSTENNLHACRVLRKRVKPVVGTCMTTGSVRRYPSIKAAHDDGFNRCCVTKCITGGASSHAGFTWQYDKPTESGASDAERKEDDEALQRRHDQERQEYFNDEQ